MLTVEVGVEVRVEVGGCKNIADKSTKVNGVELVGDKVEVEVEVELNW